MLVQKDRMGLIALIALVTGNMIGSGIFLLPAALSAYGSIGIAGWVMTAIGAMLLARVFADLSQMLPKTGGPYAYCRAAFGDFVGFQIAYNYWLAMWIGNAAIVVALVSYLTIFFPILNADSTLAFFVKISIVWLLTAVNLSGVRYVALVQISGMILKLIPLLFVIVFGFFFFDVHNLQPFNHTSSTHFSALTASATLTMWSFIGLESATVPASYAKNARLIARATIIGTLIAASIYILSTLAIMGMIPVVELAQSGAPFADATAHILQGLGHHMGASAAHQQLFSALGAASVALGAVVSCLGALNGWILLQGQIPYAAAQDGLFPSFFGKCSSRGLPANALIVSSVCITLLLALTINDALLKQFTTIIMLATLASLIPYFFTCAAYVRLMSARRALPENWRKSVIMGVLAGVYAFWAIAGATDKIMSYGALLFFSSVPVYVWLQWRQQRPLCLAQDER